MKSHDEIWQKIRELEKQMQNNRDRQEALRRQTRAVDWRDSEEGLEYASLGRINFEISRTLIGLHWVLDNAGDKPESQMVELLSSGSKQLLHKGRQ